LPRNARSARILRRLRRRKNSAGRVPPARRPLHVEPLEPRTLLDGAGPLLITEFLADNDSVLADEDGDFSDWI
jgi:hypothetical protein